MHHCYDLKYYVYEMVPDRYVTISANVMATYQQPVEDGEVEMSVRGR